MDEADRIWQRAQREVARSPIFSEAVQAVQQVQKPQAPPKVEGEKARERFMDTAIAAITSVMGSMEEFCRTELKILPKAGGELKPLILNRTQLYLDQMAERQLTTRGFVRIIVLKARQQGSSTYIAARGYRKTTRKRGQKAVIVSHEQKSTDHLFGMVKRFWENVRPVFRPHMARSNEQILAFDRMGSSYSVGTARSGETGRSITSQFFHGSEVAFWQAAKELVAGVMQSIVRGDNTEVWLESTANGAAGYFHTQVQMARKGEGDFELAFSPWYWSDEYSTPSDQVPYNFEDQLTGDDLVYQDMHGLTREQMHWRQAKIMEFAATEDGTREGGLLKFRQEYPATIDEAFLGENENAFIRALPVQRARKAWAEHVAQTGEKPRGSGPLIIGLDPSHTGPDKFTIWALRGRAAWKVDGWQKQRAQVSVGKAVAAFQKVEKETGVQIDTIFMDVGGIGGPLYDLLSDTPYGERIIPVLFGDPADEEERYFNKVAEMWGRVRAWLTELPQVMLEDREDIQADLTSRQSVPCSKPNQVKLMSKDDHRKKLGLPSPDDGDGLSLCFAYPAGATGNRNAPEPRRAVTYGGGLSVRSTSR